MKTMVIGQPSETLQLQLRLSSSDHEVHVEPELEPALEFLSLYEFDAVIITTQSLRCVTAVRRSGFNRAVVVLDPAGTPVETMLACFRAGADDYQLRPISFEVVKARISAITRRYQNITSPQISLGPLSIDLDRKQATLDGAPLKLSKKEYDLLEILATNQTRVLSRKEILHRLYSIEEDGIVSDTKIVDIYIHRLRQKLSPHSSLLETIRGRGYALHV